MYRALINLFALFNSVSGYGILPSKFIQEAEIKHGRVAMVSSLAIPLLDMAKPDTLGINFVSSLDNNVQLGLLSLVGCSEAAQILKAYNFPEDTSKWFTMKEDHSQEIILLTLLDLIRMILKRLRTMNFILVA